MKFLTDAQTQRRFGELLTKLDWHVETVYDHGLDKEKDDAVLVARARSFGLVFLTFDELKKEQGAKVAREIKRRGGKVIAIHGGPQQAPERALGKFLFHFPYWYPRLEREHGLVILSDIKLACRFIARNDIHGDVWAVEQEPFDPYLQHRRFRKQLPPSRRVARKAHPQQRDFDIHFEERESG